MGRYGSAEEFAANAVCSFLDTRATSGSRSSPWTQVACRRVAVGSIARDGTPVKIGDLEIAPVCTGNS
jgi:hypothetical protein